MNNHNDNTIVKGDFIKTIAKIVTAAIIAATLTTSSAQADTKDIVRSTVEVLSTPTAKTAVRVVETGGAAWTAGSAAIPLAVAVNSAAGGVATTGTAVSTLAGATATSATAYAIGAPVATGLAAVTGIVIAPAVVGVVVITGVVAGTAAIVTWFVSGD